MAESLNDELDNGGVYTAEQKTESGNTPDVDRAIVKVSAGKAYVRGYEINNPGTINLDVAKPRTTETVETTAMPFEMGGLFVVNNVTGTPVVGLDINDNIVDLYNGRLDAAGASTGDLIGQSRVYNYALEDAPYTGASTLSRCIYLIHRSSTKLTTKR